MELLVLGLLQKILNGNTVIDVIIDAILSETSENPVQNKVVTKALKNKADISHKHTAVEVGADSIGSAETALNDAKKYTDGKIADIINGAPSTLDTLSEIATAMDENKSVVDALDKAIGTKANKADIPTKISELENDSNFLTEHQDLSSYAKTEDIPTELPANGGNADTVNNHTVNTDVPSDAVFTDTVYALPIATTEILGGVMPDGTTITVDKNGVISAVGGNDDWTNVGSVHITNNTVTEFSIPNLSNYKFMMLSISLSHRTNSTTDSSNYTRIFVLDDYKSSSDWGDIIYYIGNDYQSTSSSDTVYPYIGYVNISKSSNKVSFVGRISFGANIYMK